MPSPATAYSHEMRPFPAPPAESPDGDGRAACTLLESFAKEETVVLVDAHLEWDYDDDGLPTDAVFDVVAAYTDEADRVNPSTSMGSVHMAHGTSRRFLIGIPGGHKLVVYPTDASRAPHIRSGGEASHLTTVIVDYWA